MRKAKLLLSASDGARDYVVIMNALGADAVQKYCPEVDLDYDGLILFGGGDVDPAYYHEPINGSVSIDPARDAAEFALLEAYVEAGKPVLGVCRGHQLINIFFGGTLYQDISEAHLHKSGSHIVSADADSFLYKLHGNYFPVNTSHHQAVCKLGEGLRGIAYWNSAYVEGMEHTSLPVLSVQWHPERMCFDYWDEGTVDGSVLLSYFVELCRKYM